MVTSLPGIRLTIPPQAVRKKNRHTFSFILNTSKVIFICKNISVQLILHSNACVSYLECLDRYLPTRYTNRDCPPKKYGHHHDLIDQYSVFFSHRWLNIMKSSQLAVYSILMAYKLFTTGTISRAGIAFLSTVPKFTCRFRSGSCFF